MKTFFFNIYSESLGDSTGYDLSPTPLPGDAVYIGSTCYWVTSRSFHLNQPEGDCILVTLFTTDQYREMKGLKN